MSQEFKAAQDDARRATLKTISETDKEIAKIYDQAARDLARQAEGAKAGSLTQRWADDYSRQLAARVNQLNGDVSSAITGAAGSAAKNAANATTSWLDRVLASTGAGNLDGGASFSSVLSRTPDEALRAVVSGQAYLDGKSLSRRIWSQNGRMQDGINEILRQGIAQKKSAYQLAKELEAYVNPEAREEMDWRKVYPDLPAWLSSRWTTVEKNAQRLARTSINHAYHIAMKEAAAKNPFASAIHWALSPQHFQRQIKPFGADICDEYAIHDEGLGQGNWPIKGVPLPHANCLCSQYAVVAKSLDECGKELKDWLDGGENAALDAAFAEWKNGLQSAGNYAILPMDHSAADRRTAATKTIAQRADVQAMNRTQRQKYFDALVDSNTENLERIARGLLPNADRATIPDGKMRYGLSLDPNKARVFKSALGYGDGDKETLAAQIAQHIAEDNYRMQIGLTDEHGSRYAAYMDIDGTEGKQATVCAPWIVPKDQPNGLRLTSVYVKEDGM